MTPPERPMARALLSEYPEDPNVGSVGHRWLLGDGVLVAPIFNVSFTHIYPCSTLSGMNGL